MSNKKIKWQICHLSKRHPKTVITTQMNGLQEFLHCGDSILTGIGEKLLSQKRRVKIRDFRGAIATVMCENIKPTEAATVGTDIFL